VAGAEVADLFAGSGALGIEALSRGAAGVTFLEADRAAARTIRENLASTGLAGPRARVVTADVDRGLAGAGPFDVVLADPPYAFTAWAGLLERVRAGALAPDGLVVLEASSEVSLGSGWEVLRLKHYGSTVVILARPDRKGDT
jgi:16S rRNA (guanine966-N2)-methyltransferase